jgi:hypothetical protein
MPDAISPPVEEAAGEERSIVAVKRRVLINEKTIQTFRFFFRS